MKLVKESLPVIDLNGSNGLVDTFSTFNLSNVPLSTSDVNFFEVIPPLSFEETFVGVFWSLFFLVIVPIGSLKKLPIFVKILPLDFLGVTPASFSTSLPVYPPKKPPSLGLFICPSSLYQHY